MLPLSSLPCPLLPALADLHMQVMPTLLADLGREVVLRYFEMAAGDPGVIGFVVTDTQQSPIILGYVIGSPDPSALNGKLRQPLGWFLGRVAQAAFRRPAIFFQLAQSALASPAANQMQAGELELTYLGVHPAARGRGLGGQLIQAFAEAARRGGYTSLVLSVETDNPSALALYQKHGFTIRETFQEGAYHRHRMTCRL